MKPVFIPDPRIKWEWLSNHAEVMYLEQHLDKVDWYTIAKNPNAMPLIVEHFEEHLDHFDWYYLVRHPSILSILNKPHWVRLCEHNIKGYYLSGNPNAVSFLEQNPDKIEWFSLSRNSNAVSLLEQNPDKIDRTGLSINSNAVSLLEKNPDKIDWFNLSRNPNAGSLIKQYSDKIDLSELCSNSCPEAIALLSKNIYSDAILWNELSGNPNAVPLLEQRPDKIDWEEASSNLSISILPLLEKHLDQVHFELVCCNGEDTTQEAIDFLEKHVDYMDYGCWYRLSALPIAVPLLEKYPEHIRWDRLSRNPGAIHLLEQHPDKIDWDFLSFNKNAMHLLFRLDYPQMRQDNEAFKDELMAYVFDPDRLMRLSDKYSVDFRTYLSLYS
jgi:hypothetical protein